MDSCFFTRALALSKNTKISDTIWTRLDSSITGTSQVPIQWEKIDYQSLTYIK